MDSHSLKGRVAGELREQIASGRLALGAPLSDKALADELRISRTPVREALLQLRSEGLVVMHPQSGTYVFDATPREVEEICQVRAILETGALQVLTRRELPALVESLQRNVREAAAALRAGEYARCDDLDTAFHEAIVALCGNAMLVATYRLVSDKVRALRARMPRTRERFGQAIAHHRDIARLLHEGKLAAATAELGSHVGNVQRLLSVPAR